MVQLRSVANKRGRQFLVKMVRGISVDEARGVFAQPDKVVRFSLASFFPLILHFFDLLLFLHSMAHCVVY
jgi:hypothetical protein